MMKKRADRWPSAWGFELRSEDGDFAATIVNVSETGAFAEGSLPLAVGSRVKLMAMRQPVYASVVRISPRGVALSFETPLDAAQLQNLRQYRDLSLL
ncbi:PilZ domain-containing protein [Sagittula stellata]|uniref:PilZ domain-containing protein n=1 Tax=Sagittula stellata (strain ATCC 700073 / DSM 11524 / E-37) TaxID=388399 RepID=A3JXU0_SAGS3|nr:PilZ domain-containing protein [Sagittula stellata]EBA10326.1 hypothetical protein SSE37_20012 [Sagittula stellata E-37]